MDYAMTFGETEIDETSFNTMCEEEESRLASLSEEPEIYPCDISGVCPYADLDSSGLSCRVHCGATLGEDGE